MTVEQYRQLPESIGCIEELHHGEVVRLDYPKAGQVMLQNRLMRLLELKLDRFGVAMVEMPFRYVAEFDLRAADVALVSRARWDGIDPESDLMGVPELVIEVKSRSNTPAQLRELASICLGNGAYEFWIVEPEKSQVTVTRREGAPIVYGVADSIPLSEFGGDALSVAKIFET